ncbi:MAG: ornithine carbamoyltransferase [Hormoscilla sp.]
MVDISDKFSTKELKSFIGKDLITLKDYSPAEIRTVLELSHQIREHDKTKFSHLAAGKNIALLFEVPSLRTRSAFSVAIKEIGGLVEYYSPNAIHHDESLPDVARVISKFFDLIIYRTKSDESIETLAEYAEIPAINAMSPMFHPVQALTDILTIQTYCKNQSQIKIINFGNESNVSNSLMIAAVKSGYDYIAVAPKEFLPDRGLVSELNQIGKQTGSQISVTDDMQSELLADADVVYTDAWTLFAKTKEENERRYKKLEPYRVTTEVMNRVGKENSIYMHCLPAEHSSEHPLEVTNDVFESKASVVFEQAANKLYVVKALIALIFDRAESILL